MKTHESCAVCKCDLTEDEIITQKNLSYKICSDCRENFEREEEQDQYTVTLKSGEYIEIHTPSGSFTFSAPNKGQVMLHGGRRNRKDIMQAYWSQTTIG